VVAVAMPRGDRGLGFLCRRPHRTASILGRAHNTNEGLATRSFLVVLLDEFHKNFEHSTPSRENYNCRAFCFVEL
jgi:hypothetical protein